MSPATTRSRTLLFPLGTGRYKNQGKISNGQVVTFDDREESPEARGRQITVSEGHPFRSRSRGERGDIGGEFRTSRTYVEADSTPAYVKQPVGGWPTQAYSSLSEYWGPLYPVDASVNNYYLPGASSTNSAMDAFGATAVARCKPTNSLADASTFLGEIWKDGLPHRPGHTTWKDRTNRARGAGKDYLNYEFGWKPLVRDVLSLARAVTHAHSVLSQFERDSGKQVRRKYEFPVQKSRVENKFGVGKSVITYPFNTDIQNACGYGDLLEVVETTTRRWYSGAFTYHLKSGKDYRSSMIRTAQEADKLFGISLTPDTLWNLTPWSWAADWFTNTGDVISNLSDWATYGLVQRYGYMMEHTIVRRTFTLVRSGGSNPLKIGGRPMSFVTETKLRRKANPFGFGVSWDGLSPFQLSIAAALGLSRS